MTPPETDRQREDGASNEDPQAFAKIDREAEGTDQPDVLLDVPMLNVEELNLEVEDLRAHISARAELANFLNITIGVDAYLDKVKLEVKGVEAQLQLKVRLERILGTIERALQAIDNNPQLLESALAEKRRESQEGRQQPDRTRELPGGSDVPREPIPDPRDGGPADGSPPEVEATSAARRKADELGIDLAGIEGSGARGRILLKDVLEASGG